MRKARFHDLRHTAASLMLYLGIPVLVVSKVLGHLKPIRQDDVARLMDELVTPVPVIWGKQ